MTQPYPDKIKWINEDGRLLEVWPQVVHGSDRFARVKSIEVVKRDDGLVWFKVTPHADDACWDNDDPFFVNARHVSRHG